MHTQLSGDNTHGTQTKIEPKNKYHIEAYCNRKQLVYNTHITKLCITTWGTPIWIEHECMQSWKLSTHSPAKFQWVIDIVSGDRRKLDTWNKRVSGSGSLDWSVTSSVFWFYCVEQ